MLSLLAMQAKTAMLSMLALLAALTRDVKEDSVKKVLGVRVSTSLVATARRALTQLT